MDGLSHGIVLAGECAQVMGIGARTGEAAKVTLRDVEIRGIFNAVQEKVKYTANFGATRLIFFDTIN